MWKDVLDVEVYRERIDNSIYFSHWNINSSGLSSKETYVLFSLLSIYCFLKCSNSV